MQELEELEDVINSIKEISELIRRNKSQKRVQKSRLQSLKRSYEENKKRILKLIQKREVLKHRKRRLEAAVSS